MIRMRMRACNTFYDLPRTLAQEGVFIGSSNNMRNTMVISSQICASVAWHGMIIYTAVVVNLVYSIVGVNILGNSNNHTSIESASY